jgi:hypothetical protein
VTLSAVVSEVMWEASRCLIFGDSHARPWGRLVGLSWYFVDIFWSDLEIVETISTSDLCKDIVSKVNY